MVAAWRGAVRALKILVEGSNLDLTDKENRTVFHWAAIAKNPADVYRVICTKNCDCKTKDKFGETCLHKMVIRADRESCKVLCESDPRLTLVKNKDGKTPFEIAKCQECKALVSVERARKILELWQEETEKLAQELFQKQQKEAQELKRQEMEAMANQKRAEMARNVLTGGALKGKGISSNEVDDWDLLSGSSRKSKMQEVMEKELSRTGKARKKPEDLVADVSYFTKLLQKEKKEGKEDEKKEEKEDESP